MFRHAAALDLPVRLDVPDKALELLGRSRHVATHIPAMPWRDVPAFYASLGDTQAALALRLLILTAVRSKPVRFAHLDQMEDGIWTIPADLVKGTKGRTSAFRVPLSGEATRLIERCRPLARDGLLFPGRRSGVISDATMSRHMERADLGCKPHGFRSSFRDWAGESAKVAPHIADVALGHKIGSAVRQAYERTDYLDERRRLMERWADWVTGRDAQIIPIRAVTR